MQSLIRIQHNICSSPAKNTKPKFYNEETDKPKLMDLQKKWLDCMLQKHQCYERQSKALKLFQIKWDEKHYTECNAWF